MLSDELLIAYQNFTLLATKEGYAFAGFMMKANPTGYIGIGNVNQTGHELASLLRVYADILDRQTDEGKLPPRTFADPN